MSGNLVDSSVKPYSRGIQAQITEVAELKGIKSIPDRAPKR